MSAGDAPAIATARVPGFDVARALAVLGMVFVNYRSMVQPAEREGDLLPWFADRFEGRAAALFVVLAGVGIALRSRRARETPSEHLSFERKALLKRAGVLYVAGLLNLHMWDWDILHCYGAFLACAAVVLVARGWVLWLGAGLCTVSAMMLHATLPYDAELDVWTFGGAASDLLFNGMHPLFPWLAFLLVGMWLGRVDLKDDGRRRRILVAALAAVFVGEAIDSVSFHAPEWMGLDGDSAAWLSGLPRPPGPVYVVAATGTAIAAICLCIDATQKRAAAGWVVTLTATGQMAFTLYIAHAVAILIPAQHGLLEGRSLAATLGYGLAFYAAGMAGAVWWRHRFAQGPLEALIRQVAGRTTPAPWGGGLITAAKE